MHADVRFMQPESHAAGSLESFVRIATLEQVRARRNRYGATRNM
jgi:hypothetical protein